MTTPNRAALLNKIHKVLKRSHKYTATKGDQPLLEALLFACCLENTHLDVARAQFEQASLGVFRLERDSRQHRQRAGRSDRQGQRAA